MNNYISSPKIDVLLVEIFRELDGAEPTEVIILTTGVIQRLASYLHDVGVDGWIETQSSPE